MRKDIVVRKMNVEVNKPLGCMSDEEWSKEKRRGLYTSFVYGLMFFFFVIGGMAIVVGMTSGDIKLSNWFSASPSGEFKYVNMYQSELRQDFQLRINGSVTDLNVLVQYDDDNGTWSSLGVFRLEFQRMTIFDGSIPEDAYVLYYPPDDWYTSVVSEKTDYEEVHVPITKQKVGIDPTFFRDKDFPYELYPYDEIEITTNKVIKIVETNETIYDFYVRVLETNKDFNVVGMMVEYTNQGELYD